MRKSLALLLAFVLMTSVISFASSEEAAYTVQTAPVVHGEEQAGSMDLRFYADAPHVAGCDYVGMASGNKTADKFARAGFTATKSERVNAPIINELAVCMACRVKSYDTKTCILKGEIVNVSVDESALTDGKVDVKKVAPISFDPFNNTYHVLGECVGNAWGAGRTLL